MRNEDIRLRNSLNVGSHLPVLMKLFSITDGPIVEYGGGINSTIFFHWACFSTERKLLTLESDWINHKLLRKFRTDWHQCQFVRHWNDAIVEDNYSLVFIDHNPAAQRHVDVKKHINAEYVVLHDSEPDKNNIYFYDRIYPLFKYKLDYTKSWPNTTILSNVHRLNKLKI
ncbi:MAG: hypothetical protein M0R17_02465 [Candidatus Omnitrophica bacterium]|jgi:hypothetical protein|nr:hypothetical protein [Candidatus Omnitrophota bacterium]